MTYHRNMSASAARVRHVAIAALAATALSGLAAGSAIAQQQPPAAAPKPAAPAVKPPAPRPPAQKPAAAPAAPQAQSPAPAVPQAQAGAPGAPADMPQLIYSPWAKFCGKGNEANAKEVCFTGKDARTEDGRPVIAAALIEPEGEPKKLFRVTLPMPVQLPYGARIVIDKEPALTGAFFTCFPNGCMAEFEGTPDLIGKLKKGQVLNLQAINLAGSPFSLPLPLADNTGNSFAKANDGPPIDPKVFEEQQKKLQDELQKRADEARKKLESQGGAGPGASR
jgi:invasion protein IalB